MVYLYWMRSKGYTFSEIVQGGVPLWPPITRRSRGKTTAYNDLVTAAKAVTITGDNPFPAYVATWHVDDLTVAAKAPAAAGRPDEYMFTAQNTQHVNYRDTNGPIQELYRDGSWHNNDLTNAAKAPLAASKPTAYMFTCRAHNTWITAM